MSSYTIPNVVAQHPRGDRIMDVYSQLLTERIVYLGTAIDPGVANTLIAQLIHLEAESAEQEINLYINCDGGDLPSMLAIYDTMQYIEAPVATTCVGQAIGVGAVLLAAGTKGKRYALPNANIMIHQVLGGAEGQASDVEIRVKYMLKLKQRLNTILSKHTGKPVEQVERDCDRDNFMSADEAKAYGIVDHVVQSRKEIPGGMEKAAAIA